MDGASQRNVEVACLLYDIGKIEIPDTILRKPAAFGGGAIEKTFCNSTATHAKETRRPVALANALTY